MENVQSEPGYGGDQDRLGEAGNEALIEMAGGAAAPMSGPRSVGVAQLFDDEATPAHGLALAGELHHDAARSSQDAAEAAAEAKRAVAKHRRRKWWMVLQQAFFPGWAQLRRGPMALGWLGLAATLLWWGTLATFAALLVTRRETVLAVFSNPLKLTFVIGGLLFIAAVCLACAIASIMRAQRGRRRAAKVVAGVLIALVAACQCAVLGLGAFGVSATRQAVAAVFPDDSALVTTGQPTADPERGVERAGGVSTAAGRVNVLMLGGDAGSGRWGLRPDSISVLSVDRGSGRGVVVGIPRNLERVPFVEGSPLWGPYPDGYDCGDVCLINALYTYGSGHPELYSAEKYRGQDPGMLATRDAVEGVTGLTINYSVLIDMQGFAAIVDAAGGVDVEVPKETLAQDGKTVFRAGVQHMDGALALLYSRTRYDADDYGRMAKQRLVQRALLEQADPVVLLRSYADLAGAGARYVRTDIPRSDVAGLADLALKMRSAGMTSLELVPPTISVVHPDIDAIHRMVKAATG